MSNVINMQSWFNRIRMYMAGVTHHGKRDMFEVFGYQRNPTFNDYLAKYYRMGMARRIVNAPVLGIWADPPIISADNQEFNDAWKTIVQENNIWYNIIRLDKLASLGQYAVMVVGFDDGGRLDTPLRPAKGGKTRKILYLQPYHEGAVQIMEYDDDDTSERFRQPTMYKVSPGRFAPDGLAPGPVTGVNATQIRQGFNVHWTRLIHVATGVLEDNLFGSSALEPVNNDLTDIMKVVGGSAEVFWLTANRGMQLDLDKDMELDDASAKDLQKEIDEYEHQVRRFIRTRGVKVTNLGSDPPNPKEAFDVLVRNISAGTGIPQLILMGSASGHLASQQDRAAWSERLAERVTEYGQPVVLKRVLDCFIAGGVLPEPVNLSIEWPEAFKMNPLERAQTSAQMARSAANLAKAHMAMQPMQTVTDPETGATTEVQAQPTEGLFNPQEMRRMVSFGKHPPVFDNPVALGGVPREGSSEGLADTGSSTAGGSGGQSGSGP